MPHPPVSRYSARGFSLVELMIAMALGLLVLAGVLTVFENNSRTRNEMEKANRQIENGRYAMDLLTNDLRVAGYFGEFDSTCLPLPASPNACATDAADLKTNLPHYVQIYDNVSATTLTCLSDVKASTDVLVVRRASTCAVGSANCDTASDSITFFQASMCSPASPSTSELASSNRSSWFGIATDAGTLTLHKRDCSTTADKRRFKTHIYFVANNNQSGDGIPTLKRAELKSGSWSIVPLVEGIDNLQAEVHSSQTEGTCHSPSVTLPTAIKVSLLARNTESTGGYSDSKTYTLGSASVGPFNDAYKRHAYSAVVRLNNPAGRF